MDGITGTLAAADIGAALQKQAKLLYRCRACQELFSAAKTETRLDTFNEMCRLKNNPSPLAVLHLKCKFIGVTGIADLVGMIYVENEPPEWKQ